MWRPKDWKNPNESRNAALAGAFEAGADAMLGGLRGTHGVIEDTVDEGDYLRDDGGGFNYLGDLFGYESRGTLVFIPDNE